MRWICAVVLLTVLHLIYADPDPKKYKSEEIEKDQKGLTENERKFLRDVEQKFSVKADNFATNKKETSIKYDNKTVNNEEQKSSFPAVIAIEIVNDTESTSKDKRTIDANLGYGYRTNNGYSYSYFGKPAQEKGKFMIYPYSQEDIPARQSTHTQHLSTAKYSPHTHTSVEIQPSQAFELVSLKDEHGGYDYRPPSNQLKYDNVNTPSSAYTKSQHPSTLYTTYNGQGFTGLSGQFPTIMPNYFVDPTQLIKNPQYQSVGLTPEHLRPHGSHLEQRVVPVLVLRVPSSYLKNPTAELYANLPNNYPLSQHLNNVNLQELVNQYFQKNGYSFAPQIMSYQAPISTVEPVVSSNPESRHYANPYVQPAYTQADYSGVQYSAVKPVMARYPMSYTYHTQKYLVSPSQSLYRHPVQQQQYEYQYQYVSSTEQPQQIYYIKEQDYKSPESVDASQRYQDEEAAAEHQSGLSEPVTRIEYREPQQSISQDAKVSSAEYESPQKETHESHQSDPTYYESTRADIPQYDHSQEDTSAYVPQQSAHPSQAHSGFSPTSEYYSAKQTGQEQSVSVFPSQLLHSESYQEYSNQKEGQQYAYHNPGNDANQGLVISENYPTKDHTIATVLPYANEQPRKSVAAGVQSVSYVTPMPTLKYQSQYKIMVPQTVLKSPDSEKVSYVTSQSLPSHYLQAGQHTQQGAGEHEYTVGSQYVPPSASKASNPRNYHVHPKRQAKPDSKAAAPASSSARRQVQKTDKKKMA